MRISKISLTVAMVALILGGSYYLHARLVANHSPIAFQQQSDNSTMEAANLSCSYSIRELVIISAGHYLKGQSFINALSEKVELSDIRTTDFYTMHVDLDSAINSIYSAWYYYGQLKTKADCTPYNQGVIKTLAAFDYDRFQKKHHLIKDVFKDVRALLVKGDVRGVYSRISSDMEKIYYDLEDVNHYLVWNTIPSNEKMWDLNQQCAKTLLFGQYVARIFDAIK
ncbi:MAG: hypothetical protein GY765_34525 [bacterium]|nr:hypothetical protein [bacterium]